MDEPEKKPSLMRWSFYMRNNDGERWTLSAQRFMHPSGASAAAAYWLHTNAANGVVGIAVKLARL